MNNLIKKHKVLILISSLVLLISLWTIFNNNRWGKLEVIRWDSSGYYLYLPATFIYKDLKNLHFFDTFLDVKYYPAGDAKRYALTVHESGAKTNKYAIGVSLLQMPFFAVAHLYTKHLTNENPDGYTKYYQLSIQLTAVFLVLISLILLYQFLVLYFNRISVSIALLSVYFGTNLFYYTVFEAGMSHVYSFFIFSAILYFSQRIFLESKFNIFNFSMLFLSLGMAVAVRPIDIITIIVPLYLFFKLSGNKIDWLKENSMNILSAFLLFFFPILFQLLYWKISAGSWVYYSYQNESFDFFDSQILNGLFSYKKGWFVYTPLGIFMMLGLIIQIIRRKFLHLSIPILIFTTIYIYVIFSWENWYYGGGFSCRPIIQAYAFLAFPLTYLIEFFLNKRRVSKLFISLLLFLLVSLNLLQTFQYKKGIIHCDNMTCKMYWQNFFRLTN